MNDKIIERLQKILALANDRGATQGEMEAAMAKARELAIQHNIDLAALPAREESRSRSLQMERQEFRTSTRYEHPYHNWVLKTLEDVFEVRFALVRTRLNGHPYLSRIYCLGEATDVALALALFPWLEELFPKIYGQAVREGRLRKNFADANGCYFGLYRGIQQVNARVDAQVDSAQASSLALVVRDKRAALDQMLAELNLKKRESRKRFAQEAIHYGHAKGESINLRQVGAQSKPATGLPAAN